MAGTVPIHDKALFIASVHQLPVGAGLGAEVSPLHGLMRCASGPGTRVHVLDILLSSQDTHAPSVPGAQADACVHVPAGAQQEGALKLAGRCPPHPEPPEPRNRGEGESRGREHSVECQRQNVKGKGPGGPGVCLSPRPDAATKTARVPTRFALKPCFSRATGQTAPSAAP